MEIVDLVSEIERYISVKGISYDDSICYLIDNLSKDLEETK